jgi:ADP-heptose:LPS heptosyltransferase
MRQIDQWVGIPVCFCLTALRRLGDLLRFARKRKPAAIRRILFVKLAEQGATVLAGAAIRKAVEMVGKENVYFLVFEENRFILDVMKVIPEENVVTIRTKGIGTVLAGALRALRQLRRHRPDAAIDLEFFARSSAALAYLSGARTRAGLHAFNDGGPYRGDLMTHRLRYNPHLHASDSFAVLVDALELPAEQLPTLPRIPQLSHEPLSDFHADPKALEQVRAVLQKEAGTTDYSPLVLLNANASDLLPLRRWPTERYVELARRLIEQSPEVYIAFTGAPEEAEQADRLVTEVDSHRCFSMAGKTTLRDLLTLYCLADVLVTNDSGPAHFATLTPIEVITLFGPETPKLFGARTPRTHIIWKNLPCSPCVHAMNNRLSICRNNVCMQQIRVEEVLDVVQRVLKLKESAHST